MQAVRLAAIVTQSLRDLSVTLVLVAADMRDTQGQESAYAPFHRQLSLQGP